jgi:hypothetical protein
MVAFLRPQADLPPSAIVLGRGCDSFGEKCDSSYFANSRASLARLRRAYAI